MGFLLMSIMRLSSRIYQGFWWIQSTCRQHNDLITSHCPPRNAMAGLGGLLARRVAATEGGFFSNRSREALAVLRKKQQEGQGEQGKSDTKPAEEHAIADVLPEILRHSMPLRGELAADSDLKAPTFLEALKSSRQHKGLVEGSGIQDASAEARRMTFGPRRWRLEQQAVSWVPSTANDSRTDIVASAAYAKALVEGYLMILKAFLVATTIVFGGAVVGVAVLKSYLGLQSLEDVSVKGRELVQPRVARLQQMLQPARSRVQEIHKRWHVTEPREGSLRSEIAESLGVQQKQ